MLYKVVSIASNFLLQVAAGAPQPIRRRVRDYLYGMAWATDRWTPFGTISDLIEDERWDEAEALVDIADKEWGSDPFLVGARWEIHIGRAGADRSESIHPQPNDGSST